MREVFKTEEFNDFINQLDKKTIDKFEQVIAVIKKHLCLSYVIGVKYKNFIIKVLQIIFPKQ